MNMRDMLKKTSAKVSGTKSKIKSQVVGGAERRFLNTVLASTGLSSARNRFRRNAAMRVPGATVCFQSNAAAESSAGSPDGSAPTIESRAESAIAGGSNCATRLSSISVCSLVAAAMPRRRRAAGRNHGRRELGSNAEL